MLRFEVLNNTNCNRLLDSLNSVDNSFIKAHLVRALHLGSVDDVRNDVNTHGTFTVVHTPASCLILVRDQAFQVAPLSARHEAISVSVKLGRDARAIDVTEIKALVEKVNDLLRF